MRLRTLTAFAATVGAAAAFAVSAQAQTSQTQRIDWTHMTLQQVIAAQRTIIARDTVILSWHSKHANTWKGICSAPLGSASYTDPSTLNGESVLLLPGPTAAALVGLARSGHASDTIRQLRISTASKPIWMTTDGLNFSTDGSTWHSTTNWPWRASVQALMLAQNPGLAPTDASAGSPSLSNSARSLAAVDARLVMNTTALTLSSVQRACKVLQKDRRFHVAQTRWVKRSLSRNLARLKKQQTVTSSTGDVAAWTCIQGREGSWTSNTGNGYYGGLQMDYGFMQSYGPELLAAKGTADHWTPAEQMMVAQKAHDSGRGYYPWPNTARACGLI